MTAQTNRDWIQSTVEHRPTDAVPYNFMFSPPAARLAQERYGEDLEEALELPVRMTGMKSIKPLYAHPDEFGETIEDEFGVVWSTSRIDRGQPIGPCLQDHDLSGYRFPDPTRSYRFEGLEAWCTAQDGNYRVVWVGDLWERATFMRGMEPLLVDVALNPGFVESLLRHIGSYVYESARTLLERYEFEAIAVSDDYGTQNGLLISPEDWRRFIKPRLREIYDLAKRHGRRVFHHSCGHIVPVVGDLIDIGLDILHPIQPEAMDILYLKKEFGQHLTLCGGIPTQNLLVTGTPDEVRAEVRRLKQEMGEGSGYILEPGITIQADVPRENLIAMIEEAM